MLVNIQDTGKACLPELKVDTQSILEYFPDAVFFGVPTTPPDKGE
jgi:hypothetical protein